MDTNRAPNKATMDRFDEESGNLKIKLSGSCVTLPKTDDFVIGDKYAVYLEKEGDGLMLAKEPAGFTAKKSGQRGSAKALYCKSALEALAARGTKIPQTAALQKLPSGEYYAKLAVDKQAGAAYGK